MEATFMTYENRVMIQFEKMLVDGEIIIKNKNNEIIHKQKIKNKSFTMIELKENINNLFVEILDNIENNKNVIEI